MKNENRIIGIYKIENIIDGKKYIGSSEDIEDRFSKHIWKLNKKEHDNIYLQRAWNKYGEKNFIFDCIEICNENEEKIIEQTYLDYIFDNHLNIEHYYNIGRDACGGDNLTHHPNRLAIIEKIRLGSIKRFADMTIEEKEALSSNTIGDKNPNYGNKWTDEQRQKMSEQRKGIPSKYKGISYDEKFGIEKSKKIKEKITKSKLGIEPINKGKTMEESYGKEKANELKRNASLHFTGIRNKCVLTRNKPFKIGDITYLTLIDAAEDIGISTNLIRHRLYSTIDKYKNYVLITDENEINKIKEEYSKKYFK